MNETEARDWLRDSLHVSRETMDRLERLVAITIAENAQQNLIARSTLDTIWARHIVDSAQLVPLSAQAPPGRWIDLGSGAGFPGLVAALLTERQVTLVEMRRLRANHLESLVVELGLEGRVTVSQARVEQLPAHPHAVISARAFAPLPRLLASAAHLAGPETHWLLPKGRSAASELEACRGTWQGSFGIESSVTDPEGAIIVATGVQSGRRR